MKSKRNNLGQFIKGSRPQNYIDGRTNKISYCVDCNKKMPKAAHYNNHKRCRKCDDKLRREHPEITSRYIDGRTLKKYYCKDCGIELKGSTAYLTERCIRCSNKNKYVRRIGNKAFHWKGGWKHFCEICDKKIHFGAIRCNKHAGLLRTGKNNHNFGKRAINIRPMPYRNSLMRSSWEIKYARYLIKKHIKWQYEPKAFILGNTTYTPDFYLPETDTYVEIKGWWRGNSKQKYLNFRRKFGNIKLLNKQRLRKLGVI